jgi:hypothetical protein
MDALKAFGSYALFAVLFGGWPLFLFLVFHTRRRGAVIVVVLSLLTFFISSTIGAVGAAIRSPFPLYGWLALPYLLTVLHFGRHRRDDHISN